MNPPDVPQCCGDPSTCNDPCGLDAIEHAQDRDYWLTERERLDSIDKDDEA